ncbi:MAG: hypothetical protein M0P64_00040 [Candidatus Pacebacteria bacterium]|jgi:hypothetical protein|nr:hypothetical protein [Candidatus Paceibacterota bacterium]
MKHIQECRAAALKWLEHLRSDPAGYYENLEFFRRYIKEGGLNIVSLGTKDEELEMLRKKHHVHAALLTLDLISKMKKSDQVPGNPLFDLYQEELHKDMHAGHFTEVFLAKLVESKRESDYFADKRTAPPLPPLGTPERKKEEERRDGCLKDARRWLAKLRGEVGVLVVGGPNGLVETIVDIEMTEEVYQHYLHNLRLVMKAGYITLQDVDPKATRIELDRLRPK